MNQPVHLSEISRTMVTFDDGSKVFEQDSEADYFYIVLSGTVEIFRDGQKVMTLGSDSVLGFEPLFSPGASYLYTVKSSG
ncbi:MAG: cyclic nucleotide-binding domain-containing protein, partial [Desulfovibrionales bacterium]|nr:cyclic nucleotide-binding domain-containing protein [Desulfovibrionales bacterium]